MFREFLEVDKWWKARQWNESTTIIYALFIRFVWALVLKNINYVNWFWLKINVFRSFIWSFETIYEFRFATPGCGLNIPSSLTFRENLERDTKHE